MTFQRRESPHTYLPTLGSFSSEAILNEPFLEAIVNRNLDRHRRVDGDRYCFDVLDVIPARERATARALTAAWLIASLVVVALFAVTLGSPVTSQTGSASQVSMQAAH